MEDRTRLVVPGFPTNTGRTGGFLRRGLPHRENGRLSAQRFTLLTHPGGIPGIYTTITHPGGIPGIYHRYTPRRHTRAYTTFTHPGRHTRAYTPYYTPREAYPGYKPGYIHPGRHTRAIYHHIYTQGGYMPPYVHPFHCWAPSAQRASQPLDHCWSMLDPS